MRKAILITAYVLLICGCAANPEKRASDEPNADCRREYKVGSNIPVLNCETPKTDVVR